jgi:hypothetical protein
VLAVVAALLVTNLHKDYLNLVVLVDLVVEALVVLVILVEHPEPLILVAAAVAQVILHLLMEEMEVLVLSS